MFSFRLSFDFQTYDILFGCADFIEFRNRQVNVYSFKELLGKVPPDSILSS